jgi:hypothetical protein
MPSASTRVMLTVGMLRLIFLKEMADADVVTDDPCTEPATTLSTGASLVPTADLPRLQEYLTQVLPQ